MKGRRVQWSCWLAGAALALGACGEPPRGDRADGLSPRDGATAGRDAARLLDASRGDGRAGPQQGSCPIFPADNAWNTDISAMAVHANSQRFINRLGANTALHPDFGTVYRGAPNGIPYVIVAPNQPKVPVAFDPYGDESDPGPYPLPPDAPIEGGPNGTGDRHVIAVDSIGCKLYELYRAFPRQGGVRWEAEGGAIFDLRSNALRPIGWTSADAAGLPIFAGLVRRGEVLRGRIDHALRVTFAVTRRAFVLPATHYASSATDADLPPMGLRLRLKASYDLAGFSTPIQVILRALQRYGMFVADNGGDWFLSGAPDPQWSDDELAELRRVHGRDFEVVETGPIRTRY
ncbi:MAG: hypothetical protein IPG96_20690 [Proteobacteria bacterium]|nr:hypothetical protein [Pseudomonadota bacterium]